jgi:hypothetical protein
MPAHPFLTTLALLAVAVSSALSQGFPNNQYAPGQVGMLLSGPHAPRQGRTAILAWHNGLLYTVPEVPSSFTTQALPADYQVRSWNLANPANPQVVETLGLTRQPVSAHGYLYAGNQLIIGDNQPTPETSWAFTATNVYGQNTRGMWADQPGGSDGGIGDRGRLYHPFHATMWWSYNPVSGNAVLSRLGGGNNSNQPLATWDHLGQTGVVGHPFIIGNLLIYAADQTRTGVATYDISDPTNPQLLDTLTDGGPGGYWPEIWGGEGRLYVVWPYNLNGYGLRVVEVTDPSDLQWRSDIPLPGDEPKYVQFQDEFAFTANHKIDMRSRTEVLRLASSTTAHTVPNPYNPGGVGIDTSEFALPLGNLLVTGGVGQAGQGMAIWVHQAEPDTRGPEVGYHIPRAGQVNYPLNLPISLLIHETLETSTLVNGTTFSVRPLGPDGTPGAFVPGHLIYAFNDTLTFTPYNPLQPGTTYQVSLAPGGLRDAAGNATLGHTFTFSTGSEVGGNQPPRITALTPDQRQVAPGVSVQFTATAQDPEGGAPQYRFDAGDGRPKEEWSASPTVPFTYAQPGHYKASVQVRDLQGAVTTRNTQVTICAPAPANQPRHGSPVAIGAGGIAWTVNPDSNTVTAIDLADHVILHEFATGADPRNVAIDGAGDLWITCHDADRVEHRSGANGALLGTVETGYGSAPFGLVLAPGGTVGYATLYGSGRLIRFNLATRAIEATLPLGPTPRALALSGDGGRLLITRFISPLNHGEVWDVNAGAFTLTRAMRLPKLGGNLNQDGSASGRGVPNYLAGLAISPDGASAWVCGTKANTERGTLYGAAQDHDNTVRAMAARFDLHDPAPFGVVDRTIDIDNADSPSAAAFSPLGDYLFVTLQGNNELLVFDALRLDADAATGLGGLLTRLSTGPLPGRLAPQGVAVDAVSGRIVVQNFLGRSVSVYDGAPLLQEGEITLVPAQLPTVAQELLGDDVLAGKRVFYNAADARMSAEGYISCATCHVDGGSDGRVWDFTQRGEGLRRTTDLRGRAGMAHGNVHWTGNFDEIQDFEGDIRFFFGGSGFMPDGAFNLADEPLGAPKAGASEELDQLAAYVGSLNDAHIPRSPHRAAGGALTPEALAGAQHFVELNCNSCHAPTTFTDSLGGALHNVGTLRANSGQRLGQPLTGIDAPTLRGAWAQASFLHNGSAATLDQVFSTAGGQTLQGENGTLTGGAVELPGNNNILVNFDNSVEGGLAVIYHGGNLRYQNVQGGASSGLGAIEFRYSGSGGTANVTVNGVNHQVAVPATGNNPSWRTTFWRTARVENIAFQAGAVNTVQIAPVAGNLSIDHVTISTPQQLALAQPHRAALTELTLPQQAELRAFVQQLDGTPVNLPGLGLPMVAITLTPGQAADPLEMPFVEFDVEFDDPVEGLEYGHFTVGGTAGGAVQGTLTELEEGLRYRVRLAGFTQAGTVHLQLPYFAASGPLVNYAPVRHDDLAPLSDEFDNAATLANWLNNNTEEGWQANKIEAVDINTTQAGRLHLMPYASSWYNDYTGVLLYKEVTGDFVVTLDENVLRRNGQPGRPTAQYSLAGLLIRSDRGVNAAAPSPSQNPNTVLPTGGNIPPSGQPGHYTTDWSAGHENYIFLSYGYSDSHIGTAADQWHYEVKTTINSQSTLYPSVREVPANHSQATLQIARVGQTFLLLRRHGAGGWIIQDRFTRADMPATVQVGITVYTDWQSVQPLDAYHHNRTVLTGGNPDLVARVEYYRLRRPDPALTEAALLAAPVTAQWNATSWLNATPALAPYLGDSAHAAYIDPGQTWPEWLADSFTPAQLLNPAHTGADSLLAFLTGGPAPALTYTHSPTPSLTLRRNPAARGYRLRVQATTDFTTWETLLESLNGALPAPHTAATLVPVPDPEAAGEDRRFYRVRADALPE